MILQFGLALGSHGLLTGNTCNAAVVETLYKTVSTVFHKTSGHETHVGSLLPPFIL